MTVASHVPAIMALEMSSVWCYSLYCILSPLAFSSNAIPDLSGYVPIRKRHMVDHRFLYIYGTVAIFSSFAKYS